MGRELPRALLDAEVREPSGRARRLGDLVAGHPTLLVFLRHFGCVGCSRQVDVLVPALGELSDLGVSVVLVGNGDPGQIPAFAERQRLEGYPLTIVTDPTLHAHDAAGFERSVWATIGPRALWADVRAWLGGYSGAGRQGDVFQQGGVLLVDAVGKLLVRHANASAPEPIPAAVVLEAALEYVASKRAEEKGIT